MAKIKPADGSVILRGMWGDDSFKLSHAFENKGKGWVHSGNPEAEPRPLHHLFEDVKEDGPLHHIKFMTGHSPKLESKVRSVANKYKDPKVEDPIKKEVQKSALELWEELKKGLDHTKSVMNLPLNEGVDKNEDFIPDDLENQDQNVPQLDPGSQENQSPPDQPSQVSNQSSSQDDLADQLGLDTSQEDQSQDQSPPVQNSPSQSPQPASMQEEDKRKKLVELYRREGYSDPEIAYIVYGHGGPYGQSPDAGMDGQSPNPSSQSPQSNSSKPDTVTSKSSQSKVQNTNESNDPRDHVIQEHLLRLEHKKKMLELQMKRLKGGI